MAKRRNRRLTKSKNDQQSKSSTKNITPVTDTAEAAYVATQSPDRDFLDNVEKTMKKKRKCVEKFYNGSVNASS